MTREDINDIINAICPNDEDYEKPCISPKYLRQELEQLALDQRQWNEEPTTKNDLDIVIDAMEYRTNSLIENIKSEILHFANAHCSGDDINIYDVFKVIDDCCEAKNSTTKNDLGVDCISRAEAIKCLECDFDITGKENMKTVVNYINSAHDNIVNLPSVTPQEPKTGHWINKQHLLSSCSAECSSCQNRSNGYEFDNGFSLEFKYYDFCPNCGAEMREVEE